VPKQEYLAKLQTTRQSLLDAVSQADQTALTTVPICGTWTGKEVLGHVAACESACLAVAQQAARGEKPKWPWDDYADGDQANQAEVDKRKDWSVAQVVSELQESRKRLLAELESWPANGGPFGENTWDEGKSDIGWLPSHEQEHAEVIVALRAQPTTSR